MVDLSGGYGEKLNVRWKRRRAHKDRLVVFANIDFKDLDASDTPPAPRRNWKGCQERRAGPENFKNFGMDLKDSKGQRVHVDDARFDPVFEVCARLKLPVLIHTAEPAMFFQPQDKYNERWLELKLHKGAPARRTSIRVGKRS